MKACVNGLFNIHCLFIFKKVVFKNAIITVLIIKMIEDSIGVFFK